MAERHVNHSGIAMAVLVQTGGRSQPLNLRLCEKFTATQCCVRAALWRAKFTRAGQLTHGVN